MVVSSRGRQWRPWLFLLVPLYLLSYTTATAPAGYTGGYEQNGRNCSACHTSTADNSITLLTHNIPPEGYTPESTYQMTVRIDSSLAPLFGFSCSSELQDQGHTGWFTPDSTTTLTGSYIGHLGGNNSLGRRTGKWTFQWQAPSSGTGELTLFTAVVAANENNNTLGDQVYLHKVEVAEKVPLHVETRSGIRTFDFAKDKIILRENGELRIYNTQGEVMLYENHLLETPRIIDLGPLKGQVVIVSFQGVVEKYYVW